jgi:hypothetical protein
MGALDGTACRLVVWLLLELRLWLLELLKLGLLLLLL